MSQNTPPVLKHTFHTIDWAMNWSYAFETGQSGASSSILWNRDNASDLPGHSFTVTCGNVISYVDALISRGRTLTVEERALEPIIAAR